MPRPSVFIAIPKTGTSFVCQFLLTADFLQIPCFRLPGKARRMFLLREKRLKNFASVKRRLPARLYFSRRSSLNLVYHGKRKHVPYFKFPEYVKKQAHIRFTVLRDIESWYVSYIAYHYFSRKETTRALIRNIKLLTGKTSLWKYNVDDEIRTHLLKHREEFAERIRLENIDIRGQTDQQYPPPLAYWDISLGFLIWYVKTLVWPLDIYSWWKIPSLPRETGRLTFHALNMLLPCPARVFAMSEAEFDEYFASGQYRQDLSCDYFLDQRNLSDQLGRLMTEVLDYDEDIIAFLKTSFAEHSSTIQTQDFSTGSWRTYKVFPDDLKKSIQQKIDEEDLLADIFKNEEIYQRYIYPLKQTTG